MRCSRVDIFNSLSICLWHCLCSDSHFEYTCGWPLKHFYSMCEVFLPWLNNIRPGVYIIMFSVQPLLVVCFDISSDKSQTAFGLVYNRVYVRWPIEVTSASDPVIFGVFCGSEGGVMKCVWEDNWFLFSVYLRTSHLSGLNSIDHSFPQSSRLCKSSWSLCRCVWF